MKELFLGCLAILMVARLTQGFPTSGDPTRAHLIDLLQNALFKVQQRAHMADHSDPNPLLGDASGSTDTADGNAGDVDSVDDHSGASSVDDSSSGGNNMGGDGSGHGNIGGDNFGGNGIGSSDSDDSNVADGSAGDNVNAGGSSGDGNINGGISGSSVIGGNNSGGNRLGEDNSIGNNGVNRDSDEGNRSEDRLEDDFKLKNLFTMPNSEFLRETSMRESPTVGAINESDNRSILRDLLTRLAIAAFPDKLMPPITDAEKVQDRSFEESPADELTAKSGNRPILRDLLTRPAIAAFPDKLMPPITDAEKVHDRSFEGSPANELAEKDTQSGNRPILRDLLTRPAIAAFPDKLMPPITDAEKVHDRSFEGSPANELTEKDTQSKNRSILRDLLTRLTIAAFPDKLMPPITDAKEVYERSPVDVQESRETEWSKPSVVNEDRKGFSYNAIYPLA